MSNDIAKSLNPLVIIRKKTSAAEQYLIEDFLEVITKIYSYEIFKPMMDLVTTLASQDRLSFRIALRTGFELEEGNCKSFETRGGDKFFVITIKKIKPDVIIHEIGHMIEFESGIRLDSQFNKAMVTDLREADVRNLSLQTAIKDVMVMQVVGYPDSHKASELFTRYFQLLSMSREVAGYAAEYAFTILEVYRAFPNTINWIWDNLYKPMIKRIDPSIIKASEPMIIPIDEIKHKWAGEKVESFHKDKRAPKTQWAKTLDSIKD